MRVSDMFLGINMFSTAILLSGCTSASITPSVYLRSLSYRETAKEIMTKSQVNINVPTLFRQLVIPHHATLEVRTGYFGLCLQTAGGPWLCSTSADGLATFFNVTQDPLNLIWAAEKFRTDIVSPWLV